MDFKHEIAEKITDGDEWKRLGRLLGVPNDKIENINESACSVYEKCYQVLQYHLLSLSTHDETNWSYWKNVLLKFDDGKKAIQEIEKKLHISSNSAKPTGGSNSKGNNKDVIICKSDDLCNEISKLVTDWEAFAEVLGLPYYTITVIKSDYQTTTERCYQVMNKYQQSSENEVPADDWLYWRNFLSKFEDGKKAIKRLETFSSDICCPPKDSDQLIKHGTIIDDYAIKSHFYYINEDFQEFSIDENKRVQINSGSNESIISNIVNFKQWLKKKSEYLSTYDMFKDMQVFNSLQDDCTVVSMLQSYFDTNNGFAIKGCNHGKLFSYFGENFKCHSNNNNIMAYFNDNNIVLHIAIANKNNIQEVMNENLRNIQLIQSTYECLRNVNISHVAVVLFDDTLSEQDVSCICKECCEMQLIVPQKIFEQMEIFETWYKNVISENKKFKEMKSELLAQAGNPSINIEKEFKQSIFTLMAIEDYNFPTFTQRVDSQMKELKKLVYLSPEQLKILYSKEKHLIIKGGYGSGKSLVLQKKLEHVLKTIDKTDIIYYICSDRQSELSREMFQFKMLIPNDNILVCDFSDFSDDRPGLLDILLHILECWRNTNGKCHIFIEEFSEDSVYKLKIENLKNLLTYFRDSHVVLALQSMECFDYHFEKNKREQLDGFSLQENQFGFSLQENQFGFTTYLLNSSFRCTFEINEFISTSISKLEEKSELLSLEELSAIPFYKYREIGLDSIRAMNKKVPHYRDISIASFYKYNQPDSCGHSVKGGKPNIYCLAQAIHKLELPKKLFAIHLLMNYIFNIHEKFVLITLGNESFQIAYTILYFTHKKWTCSFEEFNCQSNKFTLLLTDYGSARGYEYDNVIFLLPSNTHFLKYRMIEGFSRATTSLHIIVIPSKREHKNFDQILLLWKEKKIAIWNEISSDFSGEQAYYLNDVTRLTSSQDKNYLLSCFRQCLQCMFLLWTKACKGKKPSSTKGKEIYCGLKIICENDSIPLLNEYMEIHKVEEFIEYHNFYYGKSTSVLHVAASCRRAIKVIEYLCKHGGMNINCINDKDETPLHIACEESSIETIKALVELGADLHAVSKHGMSALHYAADHNCVAVVDFLINAGLDSNSRDGADRTPLHIAAYENSIDVIEKLIENGSDVNALTQGMQNSLYFAGHRNDPDIIATLLKHGAKGNPVGHKPNNPPFHRACGNNTIQVIELFLKYDADVNAIGISKQIPLHEAAMSDNELIVLCLLEHGSNVNAEDENQVTPLHKAALKRNVKVVECLLKYGADIDKKDSNGNIPLHNASGDTKYGALYDAEEHNQSQVIEIFLKRGSDPNSRNNLGETPLHIAAKANAINAMNTLIKGGANVNSIDKLKLTPLHLAAKMDPLHIGSTEVIKALLDAGAEVNSFDENNDTPLHFAAWGNSLEVVSQLINADADVKAINNNGQSILKASGNKVYNRIESALKALQV